MNRILIVSETFDFKPSSRIYTDNGFLRVSGKAARTGVYQYLASELELKNRKPNDIVNVYRPADEVFSQDSINSYFNVDVTNDHPKKMVDAESFRNTSVGHVVSAKQDGDFVDIDIMVKDGAAIKDIESGKTQLSPGYTAVYVEEKGVAPCGQSYDFKQTSIDVNHVAIVARGRGGMQVKLNDHEGVRAMTTITLDSGRKIDIEDNATALLIEDTIARLTQSATDAKNEVDTNQAVIDSLNDEITALKAIVSDEAIAARVTLIASTLDSARKKAGNDFTCDSTNVVDIQRAALAAVKATVDWADKSDVYVAAAFDMTPDKKEDKPKPTGDASPYAGLTKDAAKPAEERKSAYDAHKDTLSNAWKGEK